MPGKTGICFLPPPFGRPTALELVEAVEGYLRETVLPASEGAPAFEARVAANVLAMVGRELALGPDAVVAHRKRVGGLGFPDDAALAAAVRAGRCDDRLEELGAVLAGSVADALAVSNPTHRA